MTNHNDLDQQIRAALKDHPDAPLLQSAEEPGIIEQFRATFRGRNRWASWMVFIVTFIMFIVCVFFAVQFFQAELLEHKIAYLAGFFYFAMAVGMLKMWQWMQMDKVVILREIKRLELQVAYLTANHTPKADD